MLGVSFRCRGRLVSRTPVTWRGTGGLLSSARVIEPSTYRVSGSLFATHPLSVRTQWHAIYRLSRVVRRLTSPLAADAAVHDFRPFFFAQTVEAPATAPPRTARRLPWRKRGAVSSPGCGKRRPRRRGFTPPKTSPASRSWSLWRGRSTGRPRSSR